MHNEIVQNAEQPSRKKDSIEKTSLLDDSKILVRIAEVLRQVQGAGIEKMVRSVKILVSEVCHPKQNLRSIRTQIILSLQRIELKFSISSLRVD